MKKTLLVFVTLLLFMGCSKDDAALANVTPSLVVGKSLANLQLKDQNGVKHTLNPDTYKIVFAFAKAPAHICNDFFNTKEPTYLKKHHAEFIADISSAPSLIRNIFILPGLKDFKHPVLLLDDKKVAAPFRKGVDTEKIIIVSIFNKKITNIKTVTTAKELQKVLEDTSPMSLIAPMVNEMMDSVLH